MHLNPLAAVVTAPFLGVAMAARAAGVDGRAIVGAPSAMTRLGRSGGAVLFTLSTG